MAERIDFEEVETKSAAQDAFSDQDFELASQLFAPLADQSPDDPELLYNAALAAYEANDSEAAQHWVGRGVGVMPGHPAFLALSGKIAWALGHPSDAGDLFWSAVHSDPQDYAALHGLADFLRAHGDLSALGSWIKACLEHVRPSPEDCFALASIASEFGLTETGTALYLDLVEDPHLSREAATALARLWVECGDAARVHGLYQRLLSARPDDLSLALDATDFGLGLGNPDFAAQCLALFSETAGDPDLELRRAQVRAAQGQIGEALAGLERACADQKGKDGALELAVEAAKCALSLGRADQALTYLDPVEAAAFTDQQYWAFRGTAWAMNGDQDKADHLFGYDDLVRTVALQAPEGWTSLPSFLNDLERALTCRFARGAAPADQSVRSGQQTAGHLFDTADPTVRAYATALRTASQAALTDLTFEAGHPCRGRVTGRQKIDGAWGVRLSARGHHVDHIHPDGWFSSACYVRVDPSTLGPGGDDRSGWLRFGVPALYAGAPACEPAVQLRPKPGLVVLFPSYIWHGTEPVRGPGVRMTAPFDLVPVPNRSAAM